MAIERRHLAALRAVARTGSFRAAGDELGYVQSAVSQQIAFLERLLGFRLLERSRGQKRVRPTAAGTVMLEHSTELLAELRALHSDMDALARGRLGSIMVGASEDVARHVLPAVVRRFARVRAEVDVMTHVAGDHELLARCEAGDLDVVLVDLPVPPTRFGWHELMTDRYVLIVPAASRLGDQGAIQRQDDLVSLRLVHQRSSRQSVRIDAQLRARGLCPRRAAEADGAATVQALVGAGVGSALLPSHVVDAGDPSVAVIEIGQLVAPRILCSAWRKSSAPSKVRSALVATAAAVCDELRRA